MPLFRSREVAIAVAGLSLTVILSVVSTLLAPPAGDQLPPGSSLSKGPDGSAAAYLTLASLGYDVRRSYDPIASLSADPASTVLVLAQPAQPASAGDRRAIQSLVSAGGTVLVSGCYGGSFFSDRHVAFSHVEDARLFRALLRSPLTDGVSAVWMDAACLRPDLESRFLPLYGDGASHVVAVSRVGRGTAIWWAGNSPIANTAIDREGHLELLLNVVGGPGRTILWDEFYHGQHRSLYSYARHTPLPWVFAQLVLVTAVAAAMYVRRRAPVIEQTAESRVSPLEFVETMGGLYAQADTAAEVVSTARARLRRLIVEATGVTARGSDAQLAAAAAARLRLDERELGDALLAAERHATQGGTPQQALPLVRRLQTLAAAVERIGG